MSTPVKPAKAGQMSSRLATMKFMQRAVASSPTTKSDQSPSEPSSKRRRTGEHSYATDQSADLRAIQEAVAAEELKRTQALERQATEAGDTKWVLDIKGSPPYRGGATFNVVNAGYGVIDTSILAAQIDGDDDDDDNSILTAHHSGRKSFGDFGKALQTTHGGQDDSEAGSSHSEDSGDSNQDSDSGADSSNRRSAGQASEEARAKRTARRKAQQAEAAQLADIRRNKAIKLNKLSSISSGGGLKSKGSPSNANITCYACGKVGHRKQECPNSRAFRDRR